MHRRGMSPGSDCLPTGECWLLPESELDFESVAYIRCGYARVNKGHFNTRIRVNDGQAHGKWESAYFAPCAGAVHELACHTS